MKTFFNKNWISIVCLAVGLFIGLLAGRQTVEVGEPTVRYASGDPLIFRPSVPKPAVTKPSAKEELKLATEPAPKDVKLPETGDSAATLATVYDWNLARAYESLVFNNSSIGKLSYTAKVQYNQLQLFDYEFTPIIKEVTIYKEHVWQPYMGASYSTLGYVGVGGGVFYKKLGFEYQYQIDLGLREVNYSGHTFGIRYKF
jgi:hypothetical protein